MKIENLYARQIDRNINPAVVVSQMNEVEVQQEIEEYIFTTDLLVNVHKFLNAITSSKKGKTGVWINGYYGSGKSHFIKYLFYCLNQQHRGKALQHFIENVQEQKDPLAEITPAKARSLQRKLDKALIEEIIFNIDTVSGDKKNTDKQVITHIFFNQLNRFRGYNDKNIPLALLLEKPLEKAGKLAEFKESIEGEIGETWDGNQMRYVDTYLDSVLEIAKDFLPKIDTKSLYQAISNPRHYNINDLIREFQDFLKEKPTDYRLIFLLDEVSQYIGTDTSLLLNLQSIVEEIGSKCSGKIWIVCTAQQELGNLISKNKSDSKSADFGKILGRFEVRISLQSQDASLITKKRVLDKKSEGINALTSFHKKNSGGIENQFVFGHDLYKSYNDKEDFILTYPFIPYQFRLITDVFSSFSQARYVGEGVRDTERSILGITHFTANLCKDKEVGYFVPFDLFFNEQFQANLTHFARNIVNRAYQINEVKENPFAQRVVNILFMISNISESLQVNFPATVENIALLLLDNLEATKKSMQEKAQKVLQILVDKKIIQESENVFRFLKEDEIEVANLIESTSVGLDDRIKLFFKNIIEPLVHFPSRYNYSFNNNTFTAGVTIDDKQFNNTRGDFGLHFSLFDSQSVESQALKANKHTLVCCLHEWFSKDETFKKNYNQYLKTALFIKERLAKSDGDRRNTILTFEKVNKKRLEGLQKQFRKQIVETKFISDQQVIEPNATSRGQSIKDLFKKRIDEHLTTIFHKNRLVQDYATTDKELVNQGKIKQQAFDKSLTPAEAEVESKLKLYGTEYVLSDLVKDFKKAPYGWKTVATVDVTLRLGQKEKRRFELQNEEITLEAFAREGTSTRQHARIVIKPEVGISTEILAQFTEEINTIFKENLLPAKVGNAKETARLFKEKLKPYIKNLNTFKEDYEGYPFNQIFKSFYRSLVDLLQERNNTKLFDRVHDHKKDLIEQRDNYAQLKEFIEDRIEKYTNIKAFENKNQENFKNLDEVSEVKAVRLKTYFDSDGQPWDRFPEMLRIFKELNKAIRNQVKALKEELEKEIKTAFVTLEKQQEQYEIEDANLLPDKEYLISKVKSKNNIAQLKLEISQVKTDLVPTQLQNLHERKNEEEAKAGKAVREAVQVYVKGAVPNIQQIENKAQLNEYLNSLRAKLQKELDNNKIIILK